jgi:hypothetical protein
LICDDALENRDRAWLCDVYEAKTASRFRSFQFISNGHRLSVGSINPTIRTILERCWDSDSAKRL